MHLLHQLIVGKLGKDDLVVGHFDPTPHGIATASQGTTDLRPYLTRWGRVSIADLRLPAKGKRLENLLVFLSILRQALARTGRFE
ncbi:hypothetical protein [Mesorhizobium sp. LNHC221B00]|uniref:hypothetical protein n=1 Tax=Mesorhizobium sp. LNHC221B00 TaxID=1287233 RepID=UPI0012EC6550|nr:hypothetical protein [Mesorhizobium sp. LNHC221B00]